jgi:hypothetical protein
MRVRLIPGSLLLSALLPAAVCQQPPPGDPQVAPAHKRILWIIPNYRTYPSLQEYKPLRPKQKFRIAEQDSFDRGTVALAALFAGEGQITNGTPEFGQGVAGYARYFATSYADLVIGDFMTEAIYPTLLHQDPRYFRRGTGSGVSRLGYAVGQIFWTHRDSGGYRVNFSELGGNATAVALSNAYYPGSHSAATAVSKFGLQVGVDMMSNILKEFWPDLDRKFSRKHHAEADRPKPFTAGIERN